jgi:hypothetical protein
LANIRGRIIDKIVEVLEDTGAFKKIYKNHIPVWEKAKEYPSIGIIYEEEVLNENRTNYAGYNRAKGKINILIYNKQHRDTYIDNLSDLIDLVYNEVYDKLQCEGLINYNFVHMKRDGGLLHPYSVASITLEVIFTAKRN